MKRIPIGLLMALVLSIPVGVGGVELCKAAGIHPLLSLVITFVLGCALGHMGAGLDNWRNQFRSGLS